MQQHSAPLVANDYIPATAAVSDHDLSPVDVACLNASVPGHTTALVQPHTGNVALARDPEAAIPSHRPEQTTTLHESEKTIGEEPPRQPEEAVSSPQAEQTASSHEPKHTSIAHEPNSVHTTPSGRADDTVEEALSILPSLFDTLELTTNFHRSLVQPNCAVPVALSLSFFAHPEYYIVHFASVVSPGAFCH